MKRFQFIMALSLVFGLLSAVPAMAEFEALIGIPRIQTRMSIENAHNITLDSNQKMRNRLLIMKDEGKYYWETRDRRELTLQKMKGFDLFIDLQTGGYIKVVQQPDGRYVYMEHITSKKLEGFNYWGIASHYNP